MAKTSYAIGLGSNRYRFRSPRETVLRALHALSDSGLILRACSTIQQSKPLGPGSRCYANAAALIETTLAPLDLLGLCKDTEITFGRRPGRRWGDRILDIDIILWSGGMWASEALVIPHADFRNRHFVLAPLAQIVPEWRDPVSNLTIAQLNHREKSAIPVDRQARAT